MSACPENLHFSLKGPRFIPLNKTLKNVEFPLANFLASGIFRLGRKLGPILWQLPPNFAFDAKKLESFFKLLPRDTNQAAETARRHDKWLTQRADVAPVAPTPLRHALEIRHESFRVPEFIELLRAYNVALVCADTVEWPRLMDLTSDFVYCRLHGSEILYASGYGRKDIDVWAHRVAAWATGSEPADAERVIDKPAEAAAPKQATRDVYVYFDNDAKVRAPFDSQALIARVNELLGRALPAQDARTKPSATRTA